MQSDPIQNQKDTFTGSGFYKPYKSDLTRIFPLEVGQSPHLCVTAKNHYQGEFKRTLITRDAFIIFTFKMPHKLPIPCTIQNGKQTVQVWGGGGGGFALV